MHKKRIMAHMIPYYPSPEASYDVVRGLVDGGAWALEVQFPFSDPTADGPAIQGACTTALENGFTVDKGIDFIKKIRKDYPKLPVFVMSYASIPYRVGIPRFVSIMAELGINGLIIPDLPPDYDEGFYEECITRDLQPVPVVIPDMTEERLSLITDKAGEYIYAALRKGITGQHTELGEDNIGLLSVLKNRGYKTLAGFGIDSPEQVAKLSRHAYAIVAGSVFVRICKENRDDIYGSVKKKVEYLLL
ncbi:tryptophan synthase subunit alpha [Spirochaetia bacterium 38H-sp]|uniref:Tryptophan synthase alpha chain n=1 Tax=Rarispira pelagica TaxID=3141764 RepID=A0ABU9U9M1_9SPIR